MKPDEAVDLLLRGGQATHAEIADELADALGRLPLALAQAKAYMDETGTSIGSYLDLFRKHQTELLKRGELVDYDSSVAATWEISFKEATSRKASAADLMNIGAFLAPEAIPEEVFPIGGETVPEALADLCRNELDFKDSIAALRRYSLVETENDALSFHRLVQAVARDRLSKGEQDYWSAVAIDLVNQALPDKSDDARHWPVYQRLLPHALTVTNQACADALSPTASGRILDHIGNYLRARADFADSRRHLIRAREIRENVFGKEHADVAETLNNLGWLESDQGRYQDAEPLIKDTLEVREKVLGPDHPDTAMSLNNLAVLYQAQGQYTKAKPLFKRALEIREKVLGPDHPDAALGLGNLATLYRAQGQYTNAEPLYKRALEIHEKVFGPDHPDTAMSLNNLAVLYRVQGQYTKAEPLNKRALEIREKVLGPDHPDTALGLGNLAGLYEAQGQYTKAEPLYKHALTISERVLGPEHPGTATSLGNLAGLYQAQGQYTKAEPLQKRALTISERVLGPDHPDTAQTLKNLGTLYIDHKEKEKAEVCYQKALDLYDSLLEADPDNLVFQERREETRIGLEQARNREPVRRESKVGRNDPCHCGSGLKYKRCHGKAA